MEIYDVQQTVLLLILGFTTITFLQSGLDKITDWKGNNAWLKEHFGNTFLGGFVPLLIAVILVLEVLTGLLAIGGIYSILIEAEYTLAYFALVLGAITLLMLLYGQRVAKDYPGAFTITGYFMVLVFGIFLLTI